jgi:elongation factor Ts
MSISAQQVKVLRDQTGAKMMDCKKALVETDGDLEKAVELLRKKSQASADKKSTKITGDGVVIVSGNSEKAALLEVNSQTDFVARDSNFSGFANSVVDLAVDKEVSDISSLLEQKLSGDQTVDQVRVELVSKLGENINCRRLSFLKAGSDEFVSSYVHQGKIGVIVKISGGDEDIARDMAMHVAANSPLVINPEDVPQESVEKEKDIFVAQAKDSGKPDDIIQKMVQGRIAKFLGEQSLTGQAFVKDPSMKVSKVLAEKKAKVLEFVRYEVGEGIEKVEDDFAKEVMEQAFGKKD